jgi:hypothetical protein
LLGRPLILGAPLVGVLAGALLWLLASHGAAAGARIDDLGRRAEALSAPRSAPKSSNFGGAAASTPLFAMTTGPGAVPEIAVVLSGIARTPRQTAALLAIDGKPAEWVKEGETKDDVTLTEVQAGKVTIDTPTGEREVQLGQKPAATPGAPAAAPSGPSPPPPAGYRMPPPPASAPGA